jgi:hypothetical protein
MPGMSKRPRTNFAALIHNDVASSVASTSEPAERQPVPGLSLIETLPTPMLPAAEKGRGTLKQRTRQHSMYLEIPIHDALREIAYSERTSMHALSLEGIDAVFKKRGLPSIKELLASKLKPVL